MSRKNHSELVTEIAFDNSSLASIDALKERAKTEGNLLLYHGGLVPNEDGQIAISLNRLGSQQNKKDRTYGGFYLTDGTAVPRFGESKDKRDWAESYAEQRGGHMHAFLINTNSAKILDCRQMSELSDEDRELVSSPNIDRLSADQRSALSKKYDLIIGKDLLQRTQYVLLNANENVILQIGYQNLLEAKKSTTESTEKKPPSTHPTDSIINNSEHVTTNLR